MSVLKKITAAVSAIFVTLVVALFCLLFTAPGNQFIAYSANKAVDGLHIVCLLYTSPSPRDS